MKLYRNKYNVAYFSGILAIFISCEKPTEPPNSNLKMEIGFYAVMEDGKNDTNFWYFDSNNRFEGLFGKNRDNWYQKGTYRFTSSSFCTTILFADTAIFRQDVDTSLQCTSAKNVSKSHFEVKAITNDSGLLEIKKETWLIGNKIP